MLRVQRSRSLGYRGQHDLWVGGEKPESESHVGSTKSEAWLAMSISHVLTFLISIIICFADEEQAEKDKVTCPKSKLGLSAL